MERRNWTKDELIIAFNLYCQIPFGQIHIRNPKVIQLAQILNRTPSAVSWKLVNFASFDPALQKRGIKGAVNSGKSDKEVWDEFNSNWEILAFESENLLASRKGKTIEESSELPFEYVKEINILRGEEKERLVKTRVNQYFFRKTILANYNFCCCITGLNIPELLIASHIVPWSINEDIRLDPHNGLCLNSLHDKAFDKGLITITPDFKIKLSRAINNNNKSVFFEKYNESTIAFPDKFIPKREFLEYHNQNIFIGV
ncbi:MAG: HNH endonuclease [Candidatus Margulisiibacteriota bacterium]